MNSLARLLPRIVLAAQDSPQALELAVFAAWAEAAGPATRRVAAPLQFDGRTLRIATVDATWQSQLERLTPQLLFRINGSLGSPVVSRLSYRVDDTAVSRSAAGGEGIADIPGEELCSKLLEPDAAAIADPALRAISLRAAARCLARRTGRPTSS